MRKVILILFFSCALVAQEIKKKDNKKVKSEIFTYTVEGRAFGESKAIARAYKRAMILHIQKNTNKKEYETGRSRLFFREHWLNYIDYVAGNYKLPKVVKKHMYRKRFTFICIAAKINGAKLLKDVEQKFGKAPNKLDIYNFKFIVFDKTQLLQINDAMEDLADQSRPYLKILSRKTKGKEAHIKIKWLRGFNAPNRIIEIIKEACAENEMLVKANSAFQNNIVLKYTDEEEDD